MSVLSNSNAIATTGGAYNITDSLRFRSSASAYLSRTPTTAGNRRTWTWSAWVKRGSLSGYQNLFFGSTGDYNLGDVVSFLRIDDDGALTYFDVTASVANNFYYNVSSKKLRDPSAWYHIMVSIDTTQATASDRFKLYVNNEQVTSFTGGTVDPLLNYQTGVNSSTGNHRIGYFRSTYPYYFDGYMTEVNFVDGQALDPSDFGETNTDGVWSPKEYTGTYGTNGFYLPMKETTQATGFNTVLFDAQNSSQSITGVGFSPDLVWLKNRTSAGNHYLLDSIRGPANLLYSDGTSAEGTASSFVTSLDSDGFTINSNAVYTAGNDIVAWCWDAGSSTVSNTDGTITSSVRANPASGFSVVTWTGTSTNASTIGHGLSTAPKLIITKSRSNASSWIVGIGNISGFSVNDYLVLQSTGAKANSSTFYQAYGSDTFTVGVSASNEMNKTGNNYVSYCFSEVSGYSKFGSYTGTGASGNSVTTGFRPAFVMIKCSSTSGAGYEWIMFDNTRTPNANEKANKILLANDSSAEITILSGDGIKFTDTGFQMIDTNQSRNASGQTYIYMAFADTRDFQWNFDASGNKNNWTPNNINSNASSETTYDLMSDVPSLADEDTGNFATLNPINVSGGGSTITNGNLSCSAGSVTTYGKILGSIGMTTGKWYWEVTITAVGSLAMVGIGDGTPPSGSFGLGGVAGELSYFSNGNKYTNAVSSAYGASYTTNDIIGVAYDADAGSITFYKNNVSQGAITGYSGTKYPAVGSGGGTNPQYAVNFGQRPFAYTPPTGYKKLNTYNLPDSSITDGSQYMNPVLYTGNGTSQSITGLGFSPDFVWVKSRNTAYSHTLTDSVRGYDKRLYTNLTNAEVTGTTALQSFDADGFSLGSFAGVNAVSEPYVAWNWRGSDSTAVSNTDGTITSTVSANTTSGFSVVTFTGSGTGTVGHGLSQTPEFWIIKNRDAASNWFVYTQKIDGSLDFFYLNLTDAKRDSALDLPTNSVISVNSTVVGTGDKAIAYCFHSVEGFSKIGTYTGNGSADGAFTYLGFKPAFVIQKRTDTAAGWITQDTARNPYNESDKVLFPNSSSAENTGTYKIDALSNGFKLRDSATATNASGGTYIYMAFAENPFKNSLAR